MIRRPPRSTLSSSSAASDVYKRQIVKLSMIFPPLRYLQGFPLPRRIGKLFRLNNVDQRGGVDFVSSINNFCLLYTSDAADEEDSVDLGGRRIIKKKKKKK